MWTVTEKRELSLVFCFLCQHQRPDVCFSLPLGKACCLSPSPIPLWRRQTEEGCESGVITVFNSQSKKRNEVFTLLKSTTHVTPGCRCPVGSLPTSVTSLPAGGHQQHHQGGSSTPSSADPDCENTRHPAAALIEPCFSQTSSL